MGPPLIAFAGDSNTLRPGTNGDRLTKFNGPLIPLSRPNRGQNS